MDVLCLPWIEYPLLKILFVSSVCSNYFVCVKHRSLLSVQPSWWHGVARLRADVLQQNQSAVARIEGTQKIPSFVLTLTRVWQCQSVLLVILEDVCSVFPSIGCSATVGASVKDASNKCGHTFSFTEFLLFPPKARLWLNTDGITVISGL